MPQCAANLALSQISHGIVPLADYDRTGPNEVVVGYTPTMVKIKLLDAALDTELLLDWYGTEVDQMWTPTAMVDSCIEVTERGFILDGVAANALDGDTRTFIWETYGCKHDGQYRINMNPGPVAGDGGMDFIQPVVDPDEPDEEYGYEQIQR